MMKRVDGTELHNIQQAFVTQAWDANAMILARLAPGWGWSGGVKGKYDFFFFSFSLMILSLSSWREDEKLQGRAHVHNRFLMGY